MKEEVTFTQDDQAFYATLTTWTICGFVFDNEDDARDAVIALDSSN